MRYKTGIVREDTRVSLRYTAVSITSVCLFLIINKSKNGIISSFSCSMVNSRLLCRLLRYLRNLVASALFSKATNVLSTYLTNNLSLTCGILLMHVKIISKKVLLLYVLRKILFSSTWFMNMSARMGASGEPIAIPSIWT